MIQYIFVCDKDWKIQKVLEASSEDLISEGMFLTDLIADPDSLTMNENFEIQKQNMVILHFGDKREYPAIVCTYPGCYLLFLVDARDERNFTDFTDTYVRYLSWAEEHLQNAYTDEYFQIQQLNNQLINSQRALLKINQRLKKALSDVRDANNTISRLERDELTGLYRISAFYKAVRLKMEQCPETVFDMIVLDIEQFKMINEISGRKTGDQLLRNIAFLLTGLKDAEQGIFSRASGDTFFVFIPSGLHFYKILDKETSAFFSNYPVPVRISRKIGVYTVNDPEISPEQICDRACLALDSIHHQSESRIVFYDELLHEKLMKEHQMLDYIQTALDNKEFKIYLQPKFNMLTNEVIGAEALIRWIHPKFGFIPPDQFIPLLERENSIYQVDQYMWASACQILKTRKEKGLERLPISVNVARADLYQKDLDKVLTELISTYGLEPGDLHLEILERTYARDSSNMLSVLKNLRSLGFVIEMDDFGIGESSLSMLAEMPVDVLKLDRQFIVSASENRHYVNIIHFIIQLAKALDIQIIAEGVETQEQAEFLKSMGCHMAQGYFYGRPAPGEEFLSIP